MSRFLWLGLALGFSTAAWAAADSNVTAERIAELIDELDDSTFAARQEASEQLEAAGNAAIAELELTAAAGSREAVTRSVAILKKHFQAGDAELKEAARQALSRLAANSDTSTAQRAREILQPPRPVAATSRRGVGAAGPPAIGLPAFGPPAFGPLPGINLNHVRRVTVSDIGGTKSVEIDERERRVKIEAAPAGNIEVEVTDKQNPGAVVRRFVAKDAAELAKIDPEMGRLYEQHLGGAAGPLVGRAGKAGQIDIRPADTARLQLRTVEALLKRFRERAETDPAAERMVHSLEAMQQQLKGRAR